MTGLLSRLEAPAEGERTYPARHDVRDAVLAVGGERVPVVVKRVARDRRQPDGKTRAERALAVARALAAAGVSTPEPLGIEVSREASWYVARRLDGAAQIRAWTLHRDDPARWPPPPLPVGFEEVVGALGRLARRMHDGGVFFRDFTDGNVLVTSEDGRPRLWLVDLDRARVLGRPVPFLRRLRDLARPGLNRAEDRALLLSAYFAPAPLPAYVLAPLSALRARIVLWDDLKARLRPWRRRQEPSGVSSVKRK